MPSPARFHPLPRRLGLVLLAALGLAGAEDARAEPSAEELELKIELDLRGDEMAQQLQSWVEVNSGSLNGEGLREFAILLADAWGELGFQLEERPGERIELPDRPPLRTGPLVLARRASPREGAPRFLLVGHYDTVFEPDSPFQHYTRRIDPAEPAVAYGPGVSDMKGGLVVLLYALRALHERGDLDLAHWTLLFNADEELGSLGSREAIEAEARNADLGFVFEAAHAGGGMVASRRGVGQFHLRVRGIPAHAGNAYREGRSAIRTLADQVLRIEALTDEAEGVTLNVGQVEGGGKRNIVPAEASAWVDLRYDDPAKGERVRERVERLAQTPLVDGTSIELWSRLHRPPKPDSPSVRELLAAHAQVASELGVALPAPAHSGGGTDGSLMQAVGLPTLDSLGAVGGGAHTPEEFVRLSSLPERATIAAILLRRLALRHPEQAVD